MEEEDFLHEICLTVLFSSRAARFAAVLDARGKLIVGKYRKGIQCASRPLVSYLIIIITSQDKYLCIYLESSATYEEIISKLRNAI